MFNNMCTILNWKVLLCPETEIFVQKNFMGEEDFVKSMFNFCLIA